MTEEPDGNILEQVDEVNKHLGRAMDELFKLGEMTIDPTQLSIVHQFQGGLGVMSRTLHEWAGTLDPGN